MFVLNFIRDFFLFALPVVLWGILPINLYEHVLLLIDSISILMFSFSFSELNDAKSKVFYYYILNANVHLFAFSYKLGTTKFQIYIHQYFVFSMNTWLEYIFGNVVIIMDL